MEWHSADGRVAVCRLQAFKCSPLHNTSLGSFILKRVTRALRDIVRLTSGDGRANGQTIVFETVILRRRRHGACTAGFPGTRTRAAPHVAERFGSLLDDQVWKASMDATNAKVKTHASVKTHATNAMAMKLAKALRWTTLLLREVVPSSTRVDASTASTFRSATCPMKPHQVEVTHAPSWIGVAATWVEHFSSVEVTMDFPGRRRNRRPGPAF